MPLWLRACVRMCPCCILHMWCACLSSPPCVYTWENIIFGLFRCYMNEIKTDSHYTIWHAIYKKKATIILFTVKWMMFDGNLFMSIYTEMAWSLQRDDVPQQNKDTRGLSSISSDATIIIISLRLFVCECGQMTISEEVHEIFIIELMNLRKTRTMNANGWILLSLFSYI